MTIDTGRFGSYVSQALDDEPCSGIYVLQVLDDEPLSWLPQPLTTDTVGMANAPGRFGSYVSQALDDEPCNGNVSKNLQSASVVWGIQILAICMYLVLRIFCSVFVNTQRKTRCLGDANVSRAIGDAISFSRTANCSKSTPSISLTSATR